MFIVLSLQRPELKVCMHVTNFTICNYSVDLKILLLCTKGTVVFFCYNICGAPLQPLQINFLFPIHCPHLVTVSSNYSIIPYSSIIFQLFLHTDRLSKSCFETVTTALSSWHNFTFVLFLQLKKEGTSLNMLLWLC